MERSLHLYEVVIPASASVLGSVTKRLRFAAPVPNTLFCGICNRIFRDPVLLTSIGLTLCRACCAGRSGVSTIDYSSSSRSPSPSRDKEEEEEEEEEEEAVIASAAATTTTTATTTTSTTTTISTTTTRKSAAVVPNLVVCAQLAELIVFCPNGKSTGMGCQVQVTLGGLNKHMEEECLYALACCPNAAACGSGPLPRVRLAQHTAKCAHYKCANFIFGCHYVGTRASVLEHEAAAAANTRGCAWGSHTEELQNKIHDDLQVSYRSLAAELVRLNQRLDSVAESRRRVWTESKVYSTRLKAIVYGEEALAKEGDYDTLSTASGNSQGGGERGGGEPCNGRISRDWIMPFHFLCGGTFRGHTAPVHTLCTAGNYLFTGGSDQSIKVWDMLRLVCAQTLEGHSGAVHALATGGSSGGGQALFSGDAVGWVWRWSLTSLAKTASRRVVAGDVICALEAVGESLFAACFSRVLVMDATTLSARRAINGVGRSWVRALAYSPRESALYVACSKTISVWRVNVALTEPPAEEEDGEEAILLARVETRYGSIHSLTLTSTRIIAGTYNQNVHLYARKIDEHVSSSPGQMKMKIRHVGCLIGHTGAVVALETSPGGSFVVSASSDSAIKIWDLENRLEVQALRRHSEAVNALVWHGNRLISCSSDEDVKFYTFTKGRLLSQDPRR